MTAGNRGTKEASGFWLNSVLQKNLTLQVVMFEEGAHDVKRHFSMQQLYDRLEHATFHYSG